MHPLYQADNVTSQTLGASSSRNCIRGGPSEEENNAGHSDFTGGAYGLVQVNLRPGRIRSMHMMLFVGRKLFGVP